MADSGRLVGKYTILPWILWKCLVQPKKKKSLRHNLGRFTQTTESFADGEAVQVLLGLNFVPAEDFSLVFPRVFRWRKGGLKRNLL